MVSSTHAYDDAEQQYFFTGGIGHVFRSTVGPSYVSETGDGAENPAGDTDMTRATLFPTVTVIPLSLYVHTHASSITKRNGSVTLPRAGTVTVQLTYRPATLHPGGMPVRRSSKGNVSVIDTVAGSVPLFPMTIEYSTTSPGLRTPLCGAGGSVVARIIVFAIVTVLLGGTLEEDDDVFDDDADEPAHACGVHCLPLPT